MPIAVLHGIHIHTLHTLPDRLGLISPSDPADDCCAGRALPLLRYPSSPSSSSSSPLPAPSASSSSSSSSYVRRPLSGMGNRTIKRSARPPACPPPLRPFRSFARRVACPFFGRARCHAASIVRSLERTRVTKGPSADSYHGLREKVRFLEEDGGSPRSYRFTVGRWTWRGPLTLSERVCSCVRMCIVCGREGEGGEGREREEGGIRVWRSTSAQSNFLSGVRSMRRAVHRARARPTDNASCLIAALCRAAVYTCCCCRDGRCLLRRRHRRRR